MVPGILEEDVRFASIAILAAAVLVLPILAEAQGGRQVSIQFGNEIVPLTSRARTVGGLLSELSISLPSDLRGDIDPALDAALSDGQTVYLNGVTVTRGTTERAIPCEVEFLECWRHGPESFDVAKPGSEGLARTTMTMFYADGVEIGRRQREELVREMEPKVMVHFRALSADQDGPSAEEILAQRAKPGAWHEPPTRYRKAVTMTSTAYEPGPRSCGPNAKGITSCGLKAGYGIVAIDPRVIPYGTRVFVEGYGFAVAGDTGGAIKGNKIDVGFLTVPECMQWGRKKVKVYILH